MVVVMAPAESEMEAGWRVMKELYFMGVFNVGT